MAYSFPPQHGDGGREAETLTTTAVAEIQVGDRTRRQQLLRSVRSLFDAWPTMRSRVLEPLWDPTLSLDPDEQRFAAALQQAFRDPDV